MKLTDLFIRRPVMSVVVSVFVLLLGLGAEQRLPVRQFPRTVNAVIEVDTTYYGANADVVAGFITTPVENAMARVNGIDYITGSSSSGSSQVQAFLQLNHDPDQALTEIQAQISAVHDQLPAQSQSPQIHLQTGGDSSMYLAFKSNVLTPEQITDFLTRIAAPQFQSIPGVQNAQVLDGQNFALRAWLDPVRMAARGLTASDVAAAMTANNFTSGAGTTGGEMIQIPLGLTTSVHSADEFRKLIIRQSGGAVVRLSDVARVELSSDNMQQAGTYKGENAIFIGIAAVPQANVLDVITRARAKFDAIAAQLPQGMTAEVAYDATVEVRGSIFEVVKTLLESLAIVALVVFAFLRSVRAAFIPVVTIPLSLIGTFAIIYAFGFSINLLTLLALVLATGLVVDDAIIVVENVSREIGEGASPLEAALRSARQLASPIIAMTVVLVAVYVPIALRRGLTGALFTEFAMTLVGSVTVSALLALTLSPMMCRFLLKPARRGTVHETHGADRMHRVYGAMLRWALSWRVVLVLFGVGVLGLSGYFYTASHTELAPQEDAGFLAIGGAVSPTASFDQLDMYAQQVDGVMLRDPAVDGTFLFTSPGQIGGGVKLRSIAKRDPATQVAARLQGSVSKVAGADVALFQPPSLPGSFGMPISYVLKSTQSFADLDVVSARFLDEARKTGLFAYVDRDLKIDLPQADVVIDRNKVAALGLDMARVAGVLNTLLSGGYVNYFDMAGRSYKVIPEVQRSDRLNPDQLGQYTIADIGGVPIPLSSVAHIQMRVVPESLSHFQQMNAATISGVPMPGASTGDILRALDAIAARVLPAGYATDTSGPLRQFVTESSGFAATFGFAVIVIYLSLAALFGSFLDPLIILISVPMSLAGALLFVYLGVHGASLNIYSEVGLVTLMGLISKHGILMVEVANEQQAAGLSKRAAIELAALLRLRPILMTTAAMVLGVMPLVFATGSGAAARFAMGLVIATGLAIGTVFTLFVVPAFYLVLARTNTAKVKVRAQPALAE